MLLEFKSRRKYLEVFKNLFVDSGHGVQTPVRVFIDDVSPTVQMMEVQFANLSRNLRGLVCFFMQ